MKRMALVALVLAALALPLTARAEWSEPPPGSPGDIWNAMRPVAGWFHRAIWDRSIDLWDGVTLHYRVRPAVPGGIVPTVSGR